MTQYSEQHTYESFQWDMLMLDVIFIVFIIPRFSKYINLDFVNYVYVYVAYV